MVKNKKAVGIVTVCIVLGILFAYAMQMSPSPILLEIRDYYAITNNDTLLNMAVSIIFLTIVIGCLIGAKVEQKIGTRNLFILSMSLILAGGLLSLAAFRYAILLVARALYGLGFGFSVQFIGSAIMKYYDPIAREKMNTLNGMFPFFGTVISFFLAAPLSKLLGGFKTSLAIWTIPVAIALILWALLTREKTLPDYTLGETPEDAEPEQHIYRNLWSRKEIRLLSITFVCDFTVYSYIAVILPTLFFEATEMSQEIAGLVAAIAFPAFGILGSSLGGVFLNKTGLRKPTLLTGQILKFFGVCIATLGCSISPAFLVGGICLFGIGNGLWMPALYCVPMDLKGMTSTLSGAAFALMTACGMTAGFLAPSIGGWLTNLLMNSSGLTDAVASHAFGLKWSLFIFGFTNVVSTLCMLFFKETGTRRGK